MGVGLVAGNGSLAACVTSKSENKVSGGRGKKMTCFLAGKVALIVALKVVK